MWLVRLTKTGDLWSSKQKEKRTTVKPGKEMWKSCCPQKDDESDSNAHGDESIHIKKIIFMVGPR